jgi:hypothetical protein
MNTCRICGERKEVREFFRVKGFRDYIARKLIWCQDCQRMYIAMKKQEANKRSLEVKDWKFCVSFF